MTETLRLGDHCYKIGSGATPRGGKETYSDDGPVALIRSQNVYNDRFSHAGLAFISHEQAAQLQNVEVNDGDVLLNITGDSVARACQVDRTVLPARVNQHVAIIRPRPERVDPRFLRYFLVTPVMQALMLGLAAAGATRNALTKSMIEDFRIPAWPVETQGAIASVLDALDDKIDLNRRMNETLEAMARAIFKDWFVDFGPTKAKVEGRAAYLAPELWSLFPNQLDDEDRPLGWRQRPVYGIAEFVNGAAYKDMHFSAERNGLPVIKIAELKAGITATTKFTATDLGEKYRIDSGEVLFSWSGNPDTSIDTFIWDGGPGWLNQHIFRVRENGSTPRAMTYFQLKILRSIFAEIARNKQTTGLGHVTAADMKRLMVCDPPTPVAGAYEDVAGPSFRRIVQNQLQSRTLAGTRDILLPKLMSGEIRVKEAEQEVQAVA